MSNLKVVTDLHSFRPWGENAEALWDSMTYNEIESFGAALEDLYPDGITETQINDILRFEQPFVYTTIGRPVPLDLNSTRITFPFDFKSWEDILSELEIKDRSEMQDKFLINAVATVDDEFHSEESQDFTLEMSYGTKKDGSFTVDMHDDENLTEADRTVIAYTMWTEMREICGTILPWGEKVIFQNDFSF